jgi:hypothetical protein
LTATTAPFAAVKTAEKVDAPVRRDLDPGTCGVQSNSEPGQKLAWNLGVTRIVSIVVAIAAEINAGIFMRASMALEHAYRPAW